jgi:hypothetical protein
VERVEISNVTLLIRFSEDVLWIGHWLAHVQFMGVFMGVWKFSIRLLKAVKNPLSFLSLLLLYALISNASLIYFATAGWIFDSVANSKLPSSFYWLYIVVVAAVLILAVLPSRFSQREAFETYFRFDELPSLLPQTLWDQENLSLVSRLCKLISFEIVTCLQVLILFIGIGFLSSYLLLFVSLMSLVLVIIFFFYRLQFVRTQTVGFVFAFAGLAVLYFYDNEVLFSLLGGIAILFLRRFSGLAVSALETFNMILLQYSHFKLESSAAALTPVKKLASLNMVNHAGSIGKHLGLKLHQFGTQGVVGAYCGDEVFIVTVESNTADVLAWKKVNEKVLLKCAYYLDASEVEGASHVSEIIVFPHSWRLRQRTVHSVELSAFDVGLREKISVDEYRAALLGLAKRGLILRECFPEKNKIVPFFEFSLNKAVIFNMSLLWKSTCSVKLGQGRDRLYMFGRLQKDLLVASDAETGFRVSNCGKLFKNEGTVFEVAMLLKVQRLR